MRIGTVKFGLLIALQLAWTQPGQTQQSVRTGYIGTTNSGATASIGTVSDVWNEFGEYAATTTLANQLTVFCPVSAAAASMTVVAPPSIRKAFADSMIPMGALTVLTFTISNSNADTTLNGVGFTDNLPSGLVLAQTLAPGGPGTTSLLSNTCGGYVSAAPLAGSVSLTGATLAAGASCTLSVQVMGTTSGIKKNTVTVTSTNGGTGNTGTASATVAAPPLIGTVFGAASIPWNGTTSLTFTVSNPSSSAALAGVFFNDSMPSGLVVASPSGLSNTCGGSATATPGAAQVTLVGASLAPSGSCTLSVNVKGTSAGTKNHSVTVLSTSGGVGNTATASLSVGH